MSGRRLHDGCSLSPQPTVTFPFGRQPVCQNQAGEDLSVLPRQPLKFRCCDAAGTQATKLRQITRRVTGHNLTSVLGRLHAGRWPGLRAFYYLLPRRRRPADSAGRGLEKRRAGHRRQGLKASPRTCGTAAGTASGDGRSTPNRPAAIPGTAAHAAPSSATARRCRSDYPPGSPRRLRRLSPDARQGRSASWPPTERAHWVARKGADQCTAPFATQAPHIRASRRRCSGPAFDPRTGSPRGRPPAAPRWVPLHPGCRTGPAGAPCVWPSSSPC